LSFIFGYIVNEKSGYVVGFYVGTLALSLLVGLHVQDRLYEIIKKLQSKHYNSKKEEMSM